MLDVTVFDNQDLNAALSLVTLRNNLTNNRSHNSRYLSGDSFRNSLANLNSTNYSTGYETDYSTASSLLDLSDQCHDSNSTTNRSLSTSNSIESTPHHQRVKRLKKRKYDDTFNSNLDSPQMRLIDCELRDCFDCKSMNNQSNHQQVNNQMNHQLLYQQITHFANSKPINYSDIESDGTNYYNFSDLEFDFYYSERNLYELDSRKCFDNRKYRISVVRYDERANDCQCSRTMQIKSSISFDY